MLAQPESTAAYTPADCESYHWRLGSGSFESFPQVARPRRLRIVDVDHDDPLDASEEQSAKAMEQTIKNARALREVRDRIRVLLYGAVMSDEPYSVASAVDLVMFLRLLSITQRPSIFRLDNGNFQAVWRNPEKEQVSLQFFGKNVIQFAMFARRKGLMARIAGQDNAEQVLVKLTGHGSRHLIV